MVRETRVQYQVESYQRLKKKWYLIPPCLTISIMRYISRVKWSNPGKGVAPSLTPRCSSYWKGSFLVAYDYSRQLYLLTRKRKHPPPKKRKRKTWSTLERKINFLLNQKYHDSIFSTEDYIMKKEIIKYYLLTNSTVLKLCNQR